MNQNHYNGEAHAAQSLTQVLGSIYGLAPEHEPDIWQRYVDYVQRIYMLTDAQAAVALECLKGFSNQAIADHLHISRETVNKHFDAVLKKAGIHTRGQLAAIVLKVANQI